MFEQQLELFNQPNEGEKEPRADLEEKFSPDFLAALKSALEAKLKPKGKSDFLQLLVEFKKRNESLDAYDLVLTTSRYKKLAGTSEDRAAQRHAEKEVAHEMARLARELGLAIFQPAYPKLKEKLPETEDGPGGAGKATGTDDRNYKLFGRGGTYISHSLKEEEN